MGIFLKSVLVNSVVAVVTLTVTTFNMSAALASSHTSSARAHPANPAIDMIVTGSNKSSVKVNNPSVGKNECGLCYHRDTIKKHDNKNRQKPAQAYPGN